MAYTCLAGTVMLLRRNVPRAKFDNKSVGHFVSHLSARVTVLLIKRVCLLKNIDWFINITGLLINQAKFIFIF